MFTGYFIGILINSVSGFLALFPLLVLFQSVMASRIKANIKSLFPHALASYILCFAVLSIFSVTGIPNIHDLKIDININFVPFTDIFTNRGRFQYIANIMLFIPLGFLLPMLWRKFENKYTTLISGLLLSIFIEVSQLFCYRATDIDDLIMNTAGTILGYFLFMWVKRIIPKISVFSNEGKNYWNAEPYFYFITAFLVMFFIQPFISSWLWIFYSN